MKKKIAARMALYICFVLFIYISPYNSGSDKLQIAIGGAVLCFVSPLIGRWIAVHVFHCPEWDKEEK